MTHSSPAQPTESALPTLEHSLRNASTPLPADSCVVTCCAPVNIAVIKYWGKRDTKLILPINSSLSATIDPQTMRARTRIIASRQFAHDSMTLNGEQVCIEKNARLTTVISQLRQHAGDYVTPATDSNSKQRVLIPASEWSQYKLHITSDNDFPTAAGLASSAAGYACFTKCLAQLLCVPTSAIDLTSVARQGSGSACRSLHSGFVQWEKGSHADGHDSIASQVVDSQHWPEMRVLICVASSGHKATSSTDGMQRSVQTSELLSYRAQYQVEPRMEAMRQAIRQRDFPAFAQLTMRDSNSFHATCLDTLPPIVYLTPTSHRVIAIVHAVNVICKRVVCGYTFDAGPNAVLFMLQPDLDWMLDLMCCAFGEQSSSRTASTGLNESSGFVHDPLRLSSAQVKCDEALLASLPDFEPQHHKLHQLIISQVGKGAHITEHKHTF